MEDQSIFWGGTDPRTSSGCALAESVFSVKKKCIWSSFRRRTDELHTYHQFFEYQYCCQLSAFQIPY